MRRKQRRIWLWGICVLTERSGVGGVSQHVPNLSSSEDDEEGTIRVPMRKHVPNGMRTMPFPNMKIFQISEMVAASGQHILIPRQPFLQHQSFTNLV